MDIFYIWVTTLTFLGHVTSSVTWPIDPPYVISYWCPIVTNPLSLTVFEIFVSGFKCGISRMTAWPAITDKWVSYNNGVTSETTLSHIFPVVHCSFYHGLSYASVVTPTPPPSYPTAQRVACLDVGHSSRRLCRWRSLHPVQGLKSHLRLIRGSLILDDIRTQFLLGRLIRESDLYSIIYGIPCQIASS